MAYINSRKAVDCVILGKQAKGERKERIEIINVRFSWNENFRGYYSWRKNMSPSIVFNWLIDYKWMCFVGRRSKPYPLLRGNTTWRYPNKSLVVACCSGLPITRFFFNYGFSILKLILDVIMWPAAFSNKNGPTMPLTFVSQQSHVEVLNPKCDNFVD